MKHWLALSLICLLISGCGLFKKSTKTLNTVEQVNKVEFLSESNEQVKSEITGEVVVKSAEQKQIQKDIDESTTVTADEIEIKPDGSIKATGAVKLNQNRTDKGISNENKAIDRTDRYTGHIDATKENKQQRKQETKYKVKDTHVQSEPKGTSFIYFWLAIGLAVCLVIWWIRRK
ncbi:hypothetical protein [Sphingobacterium multivorum]|uniref:hypothetical protein n=1 Tax=Sphingobacterium multivorum TaxID=28454 RepID=UPI0028AD7EE0|nr:hypothetical protein [Sphingobacterium multivorum]